MFRFLQKTRSRGQNMVEFALVMPIFFLLVFGTIELGFLVYTNHTLSNATREGARFAMVHGERSGEMATVASVEEVVRDRSSALNSQITVERVEFDPPAAEPGSRVTVETSYDYQPIIAMITGVDPIRLENESTVIVQY